MTIHALGLFTQRAGIGGGFQTGIANDVTRVTGGWYETIPGPSQSIGDRLAEMAAEITRQYDETRYQYAVAYEPPPGTDADAGLSVAVRRGGVRLGISANGRSSPAALAVADAADVGNSREELFNQGEAAFAAGDSAQAAEWYQKAHDRDPGWVLPLHKLGLVSLNLGDIEGAKQWLRLAVEADASSSEGQQAAAILASLP